MINQVVVEASKNKWRLRNSELYEGQLIELDWIGFLPDGHGTSYQRRRLISSAKSFLKSRIERPFRKWRAELASTTVVGWFVTLRVIVNWMVENHLWTFAELTEEHIISFFKSRKGRGGVGLPARLHLETYVRVFEDLWTLRHLYCSSIEVNVSEFEDDIFAECRSRDKRPWRAIDEQAALDLVFDATRWLDQYGEFMVEQSHRIYEEQRRWVGISHGRRRKLSPELYSRICAEPIFDEISQKLGVAKTGAGLAQAFSCTLGAVMCLLLFTVGFRVSELLRLDVDCLQQRVGNDGQPTTYLRGVAAKKGGRFREWVVAEPISSVIKFVIRLFELARPTAGSNALFLTRTSGAAIPLPGRKLRRMSTATPITLMRAFARAPFRGDLLDVSKLHPHAARKTFAAFVVSRDKTALEALSLHFGHVYKAFTDGAYAGNLDLQRLLSGEDRRALGDALGELLSSRHLAGRAAGVVTNFREKTIRFKGRLVLRRTVDELIAKGVRLAPCNWGYCLYSQSFSACSGDSSGPNELKRSPSVCAGCANFVVTDVHRAWWNDRVKIDTEFLKRPDLPHQTRILVEERLTQSRKILKQLITEAVKPKHEYQKTHTNSGGKG